MKWYLAKMVFRIICGDGEHKPQFDEQLRLVSGISKEEAFRKAQEMGQKEEDTFYNRKEQLVQWQFINISELYRLSDLIDGAELYSRIEEKDNAEAYIYTVNQKAESIVCNETNQWPHLASPKERNNTQPLPEEIPYQLLQHF
jgi:hypothetical protein